MEVEPSPPATAKASLPATHDATQPAKEEEAQARPSVTFQVTESEPSEPAKDGVSIEECNAGQVPAIYDATPFAQEETNPPVIISYATATDEGRGEQHMWAVANALRAEGINLYTAKFTNETDWQ